MRELERESLPSPLSATSLVVVGRGRVGGSLARAAELAGIEVRLASADRAAEAVEGAGAALLCVPDEAITEVCARIAPLSPPQVGHVSGATQLDALSSATEHGATAFSLHPLQTFVDESTAIAGTPVAIAGTDAEALSFAQALAEALGMRPFEVPEENRAAYHAAAAIASNLLVALEESAAELVESLGIDNPRELLAPLVLRTAANWAERGPAALTGPIARGDRATVERHRAALAEAAPELLPMYDALAERAEARGSPGEAGTGRAGMKIMRSRAELREALAEPRRQGKRIGLVPTMGYFHDGHLSLMRQAREDCDVVVVSLFVNPTQFGPGEDLDSYPRDEDRDAELAALEGVDLLWTPDTDEMYPDGFATSVEVANSLTGMLEGDPERRGPSHFRGVTTIVAKLFNSVQPDVAYFGRKDAQQALVIERMTRDLDLPVEVAVLPTVREEDGLALSSRNAYLTAEQREQATAISRALRAAERAAGAGETSIEALLGAARDELRRAGIEPEYVEARAAEDLSPIAELNGRPVLVAVAARIGNARLIDNVVITPRTEV